MAGPVFVIGLRGSGTSLVADLVETISVRKLSRSPEFMTWPILNLRRPLDEPERLSAEFGHRQFQTQYDGAVLALEPGREALRWFPEMVDQFPTARFILVHRNLADLYQAWKTIEFRQERDPMESIPFPVYHFFWGAFTFLAGQCQAHHPDRVFTVRFDIFQTHPTDPIRGLCAFLGADDGRMGQLLKLVKTPNHTKGVDNGDR